MAPADPRPPETTGKAVASLVLSILGLCMWCPCFGSILGIVLGIGERSGVGRAGLIVGWIGLGLCILSVLGLAVPFVVVGILDSL